LRLSELGHVHRAEQSGEVNGLLRARSFVIDDAHLFCAEEQVAQELAGCVAMAMEIYDLFGLEPHAELSLRPEVRLGSDELWDRSEQALRDALHDANLDYEEQPGEGAFYGPKIDLHVSDRLGRSWQLGSVQLDYQLPQRFDLSYIDEQGERQRPVIIHRALLGSLERFIAILLEHYDGALPAWLAPRAAHILPISDQQLAHAQQLADRLRLAGVRCAVRADGPLNGRIRDAHDRRVGVIAIIGAREVADGRVAVRSDGGQSVIAIDAFVADVSERVANRQS
jgi:threonyl-tRNA synthetase